MPLPDLFRLPVPLMTPLIVAKSVLVLPLSSTWIERKPPAAMFVATPVPAAVALLLMTNVVALVIDVI